MSKLIKGENDLATVSSVIAAEWHPTKNGELAPFDVTVRSGKKAWWKCSKCGWKWETIIGNRTKGHGCPKCSKKQNKAEGRGPHAPSF